MSKKNNKAVRLLALILAILLALGAIVSTLLTTVFADEDADAYTVKAVMNREEQTISCEETILWHNATGEKLPQLFLCCYANALRRYESAPFEAGEDDTAYPEGFAPGGIQFYEIKVNGMDAQWAAAGADETFIRVDVGAEAGGVCEIYLAYDILLPVDCLFTGAGSYDWRLCDAFPTVCAYRDGGFVMGPALQWGVFPAYDAADWHIELTVPEGYLCAATGEERTEANGDGTHTYVIEAEDARCPSVVIGRCHEAYDYGDIKVYCADRTAADSIGNKASAMAEVFRELFGEPARRDIDIIISQYAYGALSEDGVVIVGRELTALSARDEMEWQLALALAKQWFGCAVNADPFGAAYISEGFAAAAALIYYEKTYGEGRLNAVIEERISPALNVTIPGGVTPVSDVDYFVGRSEYETVVRCRGGYAAYMLYETMGGEDFSGAISTFVDTYRGGIVGSAELEEALGKWAGFFFDILMTEYPLG